MTSDVFQHLSIFFLYQLHLARGVRWLVPIDRKHWARAEVHPAKVANHFPAYALYKSLTGNLGFYCTLLAVGRCFLIRPFCLYLTGLQFSINIIL